MSVYEIVTEQILNKLNAGIIPWKQPWTNTQAMNWKSETAYRGINKLLLSGGEYVTFKQAQEAGGTVKKGEKGSMVIFFKQLDIKNAETPEETRIIPMLRYYTVFEIGQCEGLQTKRIISDKPFDINAEAEALIKKYQATGGPKINYEGTKACYMPAIDMIEMPRKEYWTNENEYYSTLYHEMTHSTGIKKRLNREMGSQKNEYGREELVAEMGAAMLCGISHIDNTLESSAAYIANWMRAIKEDTKMVIWAGSQAQKAADYISGIAKTEYKAA